MGLSLGDFDSQEDRMVPNSKGPGHIVRQPVQVLKDGAGKFREFRVTISSVDLTYN